MKKLWLTILIAAFGAEKLSAQQTNSILITPALINQLADEAQTNNSALRASEKLIDAARENENSIRKWEDPMVTVGRVAAEKEMRREDGDLFYGVEQKLPLFGKPEAARLVAEAETAVEQADADLKFQLLRRDIAIAVFKTALMEQTAAIAEKDVATLETLAALAEQRYEARTGTQMDVLRLQNERARRAQQVHADFLFVTNSRVQLSRMIGRDLHLPWPELEMPDVASPIVYSARLVELALGSEPNLKKLRREVERAGTQAEQTRRQRYPDFTVGVEARNYTGSGEFREGMAYVAFNFPWGNRKKYEADFKREKLRHEATELEARDYEREVQNEIFQLTTQIDSFRREALLYRDEIIPRSEITLEIARDAWESNAGSLNEILDARRMLLDAQLMYVRAVSEQYQMLSELVLCCGLGDLEALEMLATELSPEAQTQSLPKK